MLARDACRESNPAFPGDRRVIRNRVFSRARGRNEGHGTSQRTYPPSRSREFGILPRARAAGKLTTRNRQGSSTSSSSREVEDLYTDSSTCRAALRALKIINESGCERMSSWHSSCPRSRPRGGHGPRGQIQAHGGRLKTRSRIWRRRTSSMAKHISHRQLRATSSRGVRETVRVMSRR